MLFHQLGQDFVLGLELLLQGSDAALLTIQLLAGPGLALKGSGTVLEELLEPAVENRRLQVELLAEIRNRHLLHQVPAEDGNFFLRRVVLTCFLHGVFSPLS